MTGARLQLGGASYPLPESGAFALPLDEFGSEEALDQVLVQLRMLRADVSWLPAEGGLVSNLSLLENCLLPLRWHLRLPAAELESRCRHGLGLLGTTLDEAGWLRQRPAQASRLDRQRTLSLRVLLMQPSLVLIGPGALRGRLGKEALETLWPQWLSGSLLLYAGGDSGWPVLPLAPT